MGHHSQTGAGVLLVVDDDEVIRELIVETLRKCGYTVLEARDGREALDVAGGHDSAIDLLVTDVAMPRLGGPELARELAAQRPGIRVLFVSGRARAGLPPQANFLEKPFTPTTLATAVRKALDAPAWA